MKEVKSKKKRNDLRIRFKGKKNSKNLPSKTDARHLDASDGEKAEW